MKVVTIIDRRHVGGSDVVQVIVERGGRVYAEQTKPVRGGTISRRTKLYPSYESFSEVHRTRSHKWSRWA
jgi:hypothetical protein